MWDAEQYGNYRFRIGIFDSGIRHTHEEFAFGVNSKAYEGKDFVTGQLNPNDDPDNHGTPVAGVAGGLSNNGLGASGVAGGDIYGFGSNYGCVLVNMKSDKLLSNSLASLIMGAKESPEGGNGYGVDVANISWGNPESQLDANLVRYEKNIIRWLYRNGVTTVAASGDSPIDFLNYPASLSPENMILCVSGSNNLGVGNANFSNSPTTDIIAPSVHNQFVMPSAEGDNAYLGLTAATAFGGTSFSAPLVSGATGVLLEYYYGATYVGNAGVVLHPDDIENLFEIYAKNNAPGFGHGLVDAGNTFNHLRYPIYKIHHFSIEASSSSDYTKIQSGTTIKLTDNYEVASESYNSPSVLLPKGSYVADVYKISGTTDPFDLPANDNVIHYWKDNSKTTLWREPQGISKTVSHEPDYNLISVNNNDATLEGYTYYIISGPDGAVNKWVPVNISGNNFANGKMSLTLHTYNALLDDVKDIEALDGKLIIYPNPATDKLNISLSKEFRQGCTLSVFDAIGKLAFKKIYSKEATKEMSIDVSGLHNGLYIIKASNVENEVNSKFVISK